mmetsp:Transcript_18119/g.49716  ORF Transcript_18119/g.49716 Transcript_18119/m.49716 type:complete len:379 (-) Transcript_18119:22-1158(-)
MASWTTPASSPPPPPSPPPRGRRCNRSSATPTAAPTPATPTTRLVELGQALAPARPPLASASLSTVTPVVATSTSACFPEAGAAELRAVAWVSAAILVSALWPTTSRVAPASEASAGTFRDGDLCIEVVTLAPTRALAASPAGGPTSTTAAAPSGWTAGVAASLAVVRHAAKAAPPAQNAAAAAIAGRLKTLLPPTAICPDWTCGAVCKAPALEAVTLASKASQLRSSSARTAPNASLTLTLSILASRFHFSFKSFKSLRRDFPASIAARSCRICSDLVKSSLRSTSSARRAASSAGGIFVAAYRRLPPRRRGPTATPPQSCCCHRPLCSPLAGNAARTIAEGVATMAARNIRLQQRATRLAPSGRAKGKGRQAECLE